MRDDFWNYILYEAKRRNVSVWTVFKEEVTAEKAIEELGITEEYLAQAARRSRPDPKYLQGDQECPF